MHFADPYVGSQKRKISSALIKQRSSLCVDYKTWTPIERIKRKLTKSFVCEGFQIVRSQMPLVACNGMTVAKCQGATMDCVVVSVKGKGNAKLNRAELYVACSRATTINGLFIDGQFAPPDPPASNDIVSLQMQRLMSCPHEFKLRFLQDVQNEFNTLYFHNVQGLKSHYLDVLSDQCVQSADLVAFVEPHTLSTDFFNFPNHSVVHRTDCRGLRRKRRLILRNSEGAIILEKGESSLIRRNHFNLVQFYIMNISFVFQAAIHPA